MHLFALKKCLQAFIGTPSNSGTDYPLLKDPSVNLARLLFSLKRTEYLITLIYRMLLRKASRYLAVTDTLINIIIRIFTSPAALWILLFSFRNQTSAKIHLWSKGQTYLSWIIMDLLEEFIECYWRLQTLRDDTQTHIKTLRKMNVVFLREVRELYCCCSS